MNYTTSNVISEEEIKANKYVIKCYKVTLFSLMIV